MGQVNMNVFNILKPIISAIKTPILILDKNLNIIIINKSFYSSFKIKNVPIEALEGVSIFEFNNNQWDIPELKKILKKILPQKEFSENFEIIHNFNNLGIKNLSINIKKIRIDGDKTEYIIINIEDITKSYYLKIKQGKLIDEIDYINKQIICALFKDGKQNLQQLSKKIYKLDGTRMSNTGIKKRIEKLINKKILHIQGNINIQKLGYNIAFLLVELRNYENIINYNRLRFDCPRLFLLANITGKYQLIIGLVGRNLKEINNCINRCELISKNDFDIKNSEILFSSNLKIPKYIPLNLFCNLEGKCKKFKEK